MMIPRVFAFCVVFGSIWACSSESSSNETDDTAGACSALASACHGLSSELAKECHELGHAGDAAACAPRKAECLAACPASDRDAGDSSVPLPVADAGTDGAADPACVRYCDCMNTACGAEPNYPFAPEGVCLSVCAGFSAEERACFMNWCSTAADAGASEHVCEHATGKLGLAECP